MPRHLVQRADQELFGLSFKRHSYHWPIIGYEKDLANMTASEALGFYRAHYSPNHATVVIVGDVDPDRVFQVVRKHYESIAPSDKGPSFGPLMDGPQKSARRKALPLNIQVEKILVGYPIPKFLNKDTAALQMIQAVLTSGNSSRLYRALVETGIASSVDTFDLDSKDPGLLVFAVNLQKGRKADEAEAVILREAAQLATQALSKTELERARNKLSYDYFDALSSNFMKAMFLGHYETVAGSFEEGILHHRKVQGLSAEEIKKVAKRYLLPDTRNVIIGVPKKS